ncbi:MAG: tRNA 2-thiouridine(34) synthase MnmA [Gammaproteobacteria bacterium]|nr:tRNA 2-thiouridine(34) synthase MnmA [Gammaproteobacteria bacterium]MDH3768578.1 tRNA 2-thiouridine(34) synthase MnmA [Gammaproteobacteria bacterium]
MTIKQIQRVVVGMSGGVDSSVAALLLQDMGYDVHGLFMFNWDEDEQGYCTAAEDFQDASSVCRQLGLPLHKVSFATQYRKQVFDMFLAGLESGHTPNPDVLCNREIKFGSFLEHAQRLGADLVATGHYVRRRTVDGATQLLRGLDEDKDQSYFLHAVPESALSNALFPLGEMYKTKVRKIALAAGLGNSRKRDSTGICFIGERPFREFLQEHLPCEPGDIRTTDDRIVGRHIGLAFYTLGQRQGLGIGGVSGSNGEPWYVAAKDVERNVLTVVQGHDDPMLYSQSLAATTMHWINGPPDKSELRCQVSSRYRQSPAAGILTLLDEKSCRVDFDQPQWAITPGQYAVVYDGARCLGGGVIVAATATHAVQSAV